MLEPSDDENLRATLLAFADGELDATQSAAALDYLVAHPQWLEVMRDHQRLRLEAHRVIHAQTPAMDDAFRARIAAMAKQWTDGEANASPSDAPREAAVVPAAAPLPVRSQRGRSAWWPAAAAAALLVGGVAGSLLFPRQAEIALTDPHANGQAIPPTLVAAVTKVHVDCSRFGLAGHGGPFPTAAPMAALADDVRESFATRVPYPDLSPIGYEFVGAGPCNKPLENTVHLLYRATSPKHRDTLSILVQPYQRQVDIPAGRFTLATVANAPHPSYVWRTDAAVYYLVTDDEGTAERARDVLQVASAR